MFLVNKSACIALSVFLCMWACLVVRPALWILTLNKINANDTINNNIQTGITLTSLAIALNNLGVSRRMYLLAPKAGVVTPTKRVLPVESSRRLEKARADYASVANTLLNIQKNFLSNGDVAMHGEFSSLLWPLVTQTAQFLKYTLAWVMHCLQVLLLFLVSSLKPHNWIRCVLLPCSLRH